MKHLAIVLSVAGLAFSLPAHAQDAKAGAGAVKSGGCLKCHSVSAEKDGPAYKAVAAKYKGQADAEAKVEGVLTGGKHPKTAASEADRKTLVKWVLSQ